MWLSWCCNHFSHIFSLRPFAFPQSLSLLQQDCSLRVCPVGKAFVDTPAGDLNHDGTVTGADIGLMLGAWTVG